MTPVYRAAYRLAERGIPVFPCAPNAKHPLTARGLHNATTTHTTIDAWSRRWPYANLAVPTGHRSGVVVLDIDRKHGSDGLETLRSCERDFGELPPTLTASTWSGGEHRFFRMPNANIRNSVARVAGAPAPSFDVRGNGGYVLVSPSLIEGRAYRWTVRIQPAELPAAWVRVLARVERPATLVKPWTPRNVDEQTRALRWCLRALQSEARELAAAPHGTRNDHLWRSAAALAGLVHIGAFGAEDIRHALTWACSTWGTRSPAKDRDTIERGIAFGLARPRRIEMGDDHRAA